MHQQLEALEARHHDLENRNRCYRRAGFAGLALALALGATAAVAPGFCDTVRAERLILTDADGRERMRIDAYNGEQATLQLFDTNGRELAGLEWQHGLRFEFKDQSGSAASTFRVDGDGRAFFEQRLRTTPTPVNKNGPGGECDQHGGTIPSPQPPIGPRSPKDYRKSTPGEPTPPGGHGGPPVPPASGEASGPG